MTTTKAAPTVDEVLVKLKAERDELAIRRTRTQREVEACDTHMEVLAQRMSAIQVATTTLAGLPSLAPEQAWLDHLTAWRKTLSDELLALPTRLHDDHTLGVRRNLELSILAIDRGLGVLKDTGYGLTTSLRLGTLMREASYEPTGADPDRNYSGTMPWFGSRSEVEHRIKVLQQQRTEAQARLDEALLDDTERERRAAEAKARLDALNAVPQRKVRGDGSRYDRYSDGRVVEVN
jgi:hypothetical protein